MSEGKNINELDHLRIELSGRNLIEASAGTGKTYAIACLYLRLLIESDLSPEQILVVTYTEAATEELRGRIRNRIREALAVFEGGETGDAFLTGLYANVNGSGPAAVEARHRLDRALKSFDLASIFTIHGFCLRALQDNAFESGSLYDTELVTDQADLLQEVVDDFWRRHFFSTDSPLLDYVLSNRLTPAYFAGFLKQLLGNPQLQILPAFDLSRLPELEAEAEAMFARVGQLWQELKSEITGLIETDKGLARSKDHYRSDLLPALFAAMDDYVAGGNLYALFPDFDKFCSSGILAGKKPKGEPVSHQFFELCEELQQQVATRFLALRAELIAFANERLPNSKRERNIRFFDDLLTDLHAALHGARGAELAAALGQKYQAALIDEFQDTDPLQYDIFRRIYAEEARPLFLIGDPKQAIYSFRGADIFAYLQAAQDVNSDRTFTLTDNYRSTPRLLAAFNSVFDNERNPFVYGQIAYRQVQSGKGADYDPLSATGTDSAPLQLWYLPAGEDGKDSSVGRANVEIPAAVAAEIARILQAGQEGVFLIDDRPVQPEDMAVIVRSHRQAGYIQDALGKLGIPSVLRSDKSIFTTAEARELCTLLAALADPGSEHKIRAALVTAILGLCGDDIATLLENETLWEVWLAKFHDYHQLWLEQGFMVMVQTLMSREGVRGRLLQRPDGERCLTNLLHCFEILHAAIQGRRLGIEGLVTWLGERVSGEDAAEEYQLRLETDEKAVKILTVHVSKGLEYPLVFCPFLWGGIRPDDEVVTFHDDFRICKDFGSSDKEAHKIIAQKETLAENLRLLYVALTRAKFRCYLVAGKIADSTGRNRPETSPLAYLFHSSEETKADPDLVGALAKEVKKLPADKMLQQLEELAAQGDGSIAIVPLPEAAVAPSYLPAAAEGAPLQCRIFTGLIERSWRVSSFTSFAAHDAAAPELPDRDGSSSAAAALPVAVAEQKPHGMNIFTFPRGANAGIFLHELFEKLDFSKALAEKNDDTLAASLDKHGYSRDWLPHMRTLLDNVLSTSLTAPEGSFSLADLRPGSWLTELEFFFPLKFVTSTSLAATLSKWSGHHSAVDLATLCRALRFNPAKGMVRGFMDMVFEQDGRYYLLDWKSNHLGYRLEDYSQEALKTAMGQNLYALQYLLYTVALNRYLSLRVRGYDYSTHFGGVLYFFLRGVNSERGEECGIFRDTPPKEMIADLTACLLQTGG